MNNWMYTIVQVSSSSTNNDVVGYHICFDNKDAPDFCLLADVLRGATTVEVAAAKTVPEETAKIISTTPILWPTYHSSEKWLDTNQEKVEQALAFYDSMCQSLDCHPALHDRVIWYSIAELSIRDRINITDGGWLHRAKIFAREHVNHVDRQADDMSSHLMARVLDEQYAEQVSNLRSMVHQVFETYRACSYVYQSRLVKA